MFANLHRLIIKKSYLCRKLMELERCTLNYIVLAIKNLYVCRNFKHLLSNHVSHEKSFFLDTLIPSLHCYIMATIRDTFWDKFEPNFGSHFVFLFFGAFEGPSPHTPWIFMAVCGGHCLVTRKKI